MATRNSQKERKKKPGQKENSLIESKIESQHGNEKKKKKEEQRKKEKKKKKRGRNQRQENKN